MTNQLQYELWRECNSKCTFCTISNYNLCTPKNLKLKSLQTAIDEISVLPKDKYEVVGFIGGEFFQGQLNDKDVFDKFVELIKVTNDVLNKDYIKYIWINATLNIGNQEHLYEILKYIDKKDRLWLLTSYDLLGRFHTPKMEETWNFHMMKIQKEYPEININTTGILTGRFINAYLSGEMNLKEFKEKYHTQLFFKNPVKPGHLTEKTNAEVNELLGDFFPKRKDFLDFLKKYIKEEGIYEYDKLISMELRANEVRKNYNNEDEQNVIFIRDREHEIEGEVRNFEEDFRLKCGHNNSCACYVDSDKCIICDKKAIRKLYGI